MRFGGVFVPVCHTSRVYFRDGLYHDSEVRNAKETVDTTLFRCNREVRAELNGHTTLDQTPFGLASGVPKESPRCSCAWRGMLCLGYASSGEEGIVSEVISRSRVRLSRHDGGASCLGMWSILVPMCWGHVRARKLRPRVVLWCWADEVPGRDPRRALWRWPRWPCCRGCEGSSWLLARGPRVGCGRPTGRWLARRWSEVCVGRVSWGEGGGPPPFRR